MILFAFCISLCVALGTGQSCKPGFVEFESSCYVVLPDTGSWLTAMEYCKAFGMTLTIVENPAEYNFLKDFLYTNRANFSHAPDFWTAGTHMMSTEWAWAGTNEEIEMFFWGPGEPNNVGTTERCISFYQRKNYTWDDEHCTYPGYPLCEMQLQTSPGK